MRSRLIINIAKNIAVGIFLYCGWQISLWAKRPEFIIHIKDHLFYPAQLNIPKNIKVKLIVINQDNTPEQFDSFDLNREKVIFAGKKSTIFIGPLSSGEYHFFGEYHPNTARGVVIVNSEVNNVD